MKSYLQELENNEAILLLYLAGELPAQDRLEVEQMLAGDAALRAELESLRATQEAVFGAMQTLDAVQRPPVPQSVGLRDVSKLMVQWIERQRQAAPMPAPAQPRSIPWRQMAFAAAAVLLIGVYMWSVYHPVDSVAEKPVSPMVDAMPPSNMQAATDVKASPDVKAGPNMKLASNVKLTPDAKLALLSDSLEDSNSASDESSNLHLAEIADLAPLASDAELTGDGSRLNDAPNMTGTP